MSDFFQPLALSAPIENSVVAAFQAVLIKAQQTLPWLPNLTAESADLFYQDPPKFPKLNLTPDEGLTETQQAQWKEVWKATTPIVNKVLKGELQQVQQDSVRLAANEAFWNTVYRIDMAIATVGFSEVAPIVEEKWIELRARLKEWKETRAWAERIATDPRCPADKAEKLRAKLTEFDNSIGSKITGTIAQIPGFREPFQQEGLGAIAILGALATVKTAVLIAAIVAVVAVIVYCISSVKELVNDLGLSAIGDALRDAQRILGPLFGVAILGLIGFIVYKKMSPKTVRIAS